MKKRETFAPDNSETVAKQRNQKIESPYCGEQQNGFVPRNFMFNFSVSPIIEHGQNYVTKN